MDLLITVLAGYLIGSISFGIILGKRLKGIDIREHGSGNTGVTNVLRTLGKGPALVVLVADILKGVAGVSAGLYLGGVLYGMAGGMAAITGHNYPLYYGFKGGKGAATGFGVILMLVPDVTLLALTVFILTIIMTRYVSLGSILGALTAIVAGFLLHKTPALQVFLLLAAAFVIYRHRANIIRLYQGKENKVSFGTK